MEMLPRTNSKGHRVRRLLVTPMIFTLIAGIGSVAHAQNKRWEAPAGIEADTLGDNQPRLISPIEGTWIFNNDNLKGTMLNSLLSFAADGVLVTSASLPTPSPFFGSWRQTGPSSFNAVFYTFVPDATAKRVVTSKVTISLQLTGRDALTSTGAGYTCDAQGENCKYRESFQSTGKRILPQ